MILLALLKELILSLSVIVGPFILFILVSQFLLVFSNRVIFKLWRIKLGSS